MTQAIPQFIPPNAPWVDADTGLLTQTASVWLRMLWQRVGGTIAPTNNELSATEYADAGIESLQAEIYQLRDQIDVLQSTAAELMAKLASIQTDQFEGQSTRELVALMAKRLDDIDQGVSL